MMRREEVSERVNFVHSFPPPQLQGEPHDEAKEVTHGYYPHALNQNFQHLSPLSLLAAALVLGQQLVAARFERNSAFPFLVLKDGPQPILRLPSSDETRIERYCDDQRT